MTVELPKDLDAERAVLNIMKESDTAIHRIAEVLGSTGKHFYDPAHSILYETMVKMEAQGIKLDDNVILHYLSGAESLVPGATLLTLIGGPDRLAEVFSEMHSLENGPVYAEAVHLAYIQRKVIQAAGELARMGGGNGRDANELLSAVEKVVYDIRDTNWGTGLESAPEAAGRWIRTLHETRENPAKARGWQFGPPNLKALLGKVDPGRQVIVAGRPGMGKTTSALSFAHELAVLNREPVLFVTYEQDSQENLRPLVAMETGINQDKLKPENAHLLADEELASVVETVGRIERSPLWFMDIGDPMHVKSMARRVNAQSIARFGKPLVLVVVDYIGIMPVMPNSKASTRDQELGEMTRFFKLMAKEMQIVVMVLAQLNRDVERRPGHRPVLADLRECVVGSTGLTHADTGRQVPISEIKPGDHVLGMDRDHKIRAFTVRDVWSTGIKPVYTITTRTGRQITATANHPLFTADGWKPVAELRPDDLIGTATCASSDLVWEDIRSIEPAGEEEVFDISVPGCGNFVANGIIAHNSGNIEQDADIVIFCSTPWSYLSDAERRREQHGFMPDYEPYEHIVAKWRAGKTGIAKGAWRKETAHIISLTGR